MIIAVWCAFEAHDGKETILSHKTPHEFEIEKCLSCYNHFWLIVLSDLVLFML